MQLLRGWAVSGGKGKPAIGVKVSDPFFIVAAAVDAKARQHGSLRNAAKVLGINVAWLSRLRGGKKRDPSDAVLRKLGIERVVTYQFKTGGHF